MFEGVGAAGSRDGSCFCSERRPADAGRVAARLVAWQVCSALRVCVCVCLNRALAGPACVCRGPARERVRVCVFFSASENGVRVSRKAPLSLPCSTLLLSGARPSLVSAPPKHTHAHSAMAIFTAPTFPVVDKAPSFKATGVRRGERGKREGLRRWGAPPPPAAQLRKKATRGSRAPPRAPDRPWIGEPGWYGTRPWKEAAAPQGVRGARAVETKAQA